MARNRLPPGFALVALLFGVGASVAAQPTVGPAQEFKPGDTVLVAQDRTKLMLGEKVLAELPKGTKLEVTTVKGDWIGGKVDLAGKKEVGWVTRSSVNLSGVVLAKPQTAEEARIPRELEQMARRTFSEGKALFIWDADGPKPLELPAWHPIGLRRVGFAFAPEAKRPPFALWGAIIRNNADGKPSPIVAVLPGPKEPERTGFANAVISVATTDELAQTFRGGTIDAKGQGNAVVVAVPLETKAEDDPKPLSNAVSLPVVMK